MLCPALNLVEEVRWHFMTKCIIHYPTDWVQQVIKCSFAGTMLPVPVQKQGSCYMTSWGEGGIKRIIEMFNCKEICKTEHIKILSDWDQGNTWWRCVCLSVFCTVFACIVQHCCSFSSQKGISGCVFAKAAPPLDVYPGTSLMSSVMIHTV